MKSIFTFCLVILSFNLLSQSPGDTIIVESFNYTQTHGWPWSGLIRDTMIDFPDDPEVTYEKIIMLYNMRCKDGLVSSTSDRNRGCGEWDYSCNTYIHDSSRVDSVLSYTSDYYISAFNGDIFEYVETPLYDYYQYRQKDIQINSTNSETLNTVGSGNLSLSHVLSTDNNSGKSQYLYTQAELTSAGITTGNIDGILLEALSNNAEAGYLSVNIKNTDKTVLDGNTPDTENYTNVYFHDHSFSTGSNRIQFHTPFIWNGTSNIIVEFSFTNNNASSTLDVEGESLGIVSGIYTTNGFNLNTVNGEIDIPTEPFSSISDEITISFWSYGSKKVLPINNSLFHGVDNDNNRQINLHHPWSNSSIYFDCGNDGTGYDRINKAATPDEFEGSWSHWAVTKDTSSGEMNIYYNGELWHSGTDKTRLIDIQKFIIGSNGQQANYYFGKIDEFRIWDKELGEETIQNWMYKPVDVTHPDFANLVAYYKMDEGNGNTVADASVNTETGTISGFMYWLYERGSKLTRGFIETTERPNLTFAQGDYNLTITNQIITDSIAIIPNIVREYEIIPRYGTMLHDSIHEVSVNEFWEAQYLHIYDPEGELIDSIEVVPTDEIEIGELTYFRRYPSKYEIMSFVTPYGIWLDFGMEGKTWAFDVTDYTPILKGTKRMTIERGGEWQEDMDIKFLFIVGTPPRDVLDINQLWRADSKGYNDILTERAFEPRDVPLNADGEQFKIRSTITGHGQQGEFIARYHFLEIDGNEEFRWKLWTECSTNPVYPQGGTWIYDRAGWCPGQASDLYEYDITEFVTPGENTSIDYGLVSASGTSNYIVNNQLVTYGGPNFNLDASVLQVLKPNAMDAKNDRFNPACDFPEIVIQNTGSNTITSLDIEYSEEGGESITIPWTGSLEFLEADTLVLPISDVSFWLPTSNIFVVNISNINGTEDENPYNNTIKTYFDGVDIYPKTETIVIVCKTNNFGYQTNYALYDGEGDVYMEWDNLDNNTLYETPLDLPTGCYKLQINDKADDGLTWWHNSNQGTGYFKITNEAGASFYNFETEFGRFAIHEFGIGEITTTGEEINPFVVTAYPNPATDRLNIQVKGYDIKKVSISLQNAMGTMVFEKIYSLNGNSLDTELDLSNYPPGIYMLQAKGESKIVTKKIIKK